MTPDRDDRPRRRSGFARPVRGLAELVLIGLLAVIALAGLDLILFAPIRFAVLRSRQSNISHSDAPWLMAGTILDLARVIVLLFTAIVFIAWLYRSRSNVATWGFAAMKWRPAWAIGGWLIPVANLIIPKLVVDVVWSAGLAPADQSWAERRSPGLVWAWWLAFLGSAVGAVVVGGFGFTLDDAAAYLIAVRALVTAPTIAAAVLAILVVRAITLRQQARLAALS